MQNSVVPMPDLTRRLLVRWARAAGLARFRRAETGATAVEFALVALPFFALLFAILQVGLTFFAGQMLETAVQTAARLIRTGQAQQQALTADQFKTQLCDIVSVFMDCDELMVDVRTYETFDSVNLNKPLTDGTIDTSDFTYDPGSAGDIVVVRAYYEWPVWTAGLGLALADTSNGTYLLGAVDAFKNEPFPW